MTLKDNLDEEYRMYKLDAKILILSDNLQKLVDYMWSEENRHWEQEDNPEDHIFHQINAVKNFLIWYKKDKEQT